MQKNILEEIVFYRKLELNETKKNVPLEKIKEELKSIDTYLRKFRNALAGKEKISIIAEIKKASPSKGILKDDLNVVEFAGMYEKAGASAISVLTEKKYFFGDPKYLKEIRACVNLPLLRKDFIIDEYQIFESKLLGADAVLLIASLLDETALKVFIETAHSLELDCLVETHTEQEIKKSLNAGAEIIGINNRNLQDFSVSLDTTKRLSKLVPQDRIIVSESGIHTEQDVKTLETYGVNAVLVGESIIKSKDPIKKIKELRGEK
ncbi:indole-3-glycerol phosphate synthase TrpC [bacterium]